VYVVDAVIEYILNIIVKGDKPSPLTHFAIGGIFMQIKRILLFIFISILILTSVACSSKENRETFSKEELGMELEIDISNIDNPEKSGIAINNNGNIYITDNDKIHVFDSMGSKLMEIPAGADLSGNIAADDQYIYVLEDRAVSIDDKNYTRVMRQFDREGNLVEEHTVENAYHIHEMLISGGNIFFLIPSEDEHSGKIEFYNLQTRTQHPIHMENVISVSKYKDNTLLICRESDHAAAEILAYDYTKDIITEDRHLHYALAKMAYSENHDSIIYWGNNTLSSIDLQSNTRKSFHIPGISSNQTAVVANNTIYLLHPSDRKLVSHSIVINKQDTQNIKVFNSGFISDTHLNVLIEDFRSQYPDAGISFEQPPLQVYDEMLRKKLMAGDKDFDIFGISSMNAHHFIQYNTTEDLNSYPGIALLFDDMFEGIKSLSSYNGRIYGIPVYLRNSETVFQFNTALAEKTSITVPDPDWTWSDFYSMAKVLKQKNEHYYILQMDSHEFWFLCMQGIFDSFYANRLEKTLHFDTDEFIERLHLYKRFYDEKLIYNETRYYETGNEHNILLKNVVFPDYNSSGIYVLLPSLNEKKAFPLVTLEHWCVSRNSRNKELAAAFLESLIRKEAQAEDKLIGGPVLYKDPSIYENSMYNSLFIHGNFYETYSKMLKYSKRYEMFDLTNTIYPYVEDFTAGSISAEEASKHIENRMRMVIEE